MTEIGKIESTDRLVVPPVRKITDRQMSLPDTPPKRKPTPKPPDDSDDQTPVGPPIDGNVDERV